MSKVNAVELLWNPIYKIWENHASTLGVKGAIAAASIDWTGHSWVSQMKTVDTIIDITENPEQHEYPGYNFIEFACSAGMDAH